MMIHKNRQISQVIGLTGLVFLHVSPIALAGTLPPGFDRGGEGRVGRGGSTRCVRQEFELPVSIRSRGRCA